MLAILVGMAGCIGGIYLWIYQHQRKCHRGKTPEEVKKAEEEAANEAAREAAERAELERLSKEIGHPGTQGTILERQHRQGKSIYQMRIELGMPPDPDK